MTLEDDHDFVVDKTDGLMKVKKTNENSRPRSIEYSCFFRFMKFRFLRFDCDVFLAISIL